MENNKENAERERHTDKREITNIHKNIEYSKKSKGSRVTNMISQSIDTLQNYQMLCVCLVFAKKKRGKIVITASIIYEIYQRMKYCKDINKNAS